MPRFLSKQERQRRSHISVSNLLIEVAHNLAHANAMPGIHEETSSINKDTIHRLQELAHQERRHADRLDDDIHSGPDKED